MVQENTTISKEKQHWGYQIPVEAEILEKWLKFNLMNVKEGEVLAVSAGNKTKQSLGVKHLK